MNVTRTFIRYKCRAYAIKELDGEPTLTCLVECEAQGTSMTKAHARAELAEVYGNVLPQGCTVKWKPVMKITYAMPQEEFLKHAQILKTEDIEQD